MIFDRLKPKPKTAPTFAIVEVGGLRKSYEPPKNTELIAGSRATATPATVATVTSLSVAAVAIVAVANPSKTNLSTDQSVRSCSWLVTFKTAEMPVTYIPAVDLARVQADHPAMIATTIAQGCAACVWHLKPGVADKEYCSSPDRQDQPGPYGVGHPARFLPEDGGEACELFEGAQFE